jgi:hypothetical protein
LQLADSHACLAGEILLDGHLDKHEPSALEQFADQHGWREQMLGDVGQDRQIETLPRKRLVEGRKWCSPQLPGDQSAGSRCAGRE